MEINPKIFKAYDIRGIYPTEINEEIIYQIAKGIYAFFSKDLGKTNLKLVLSGDMRISTPSLTKEVKKALIECGCEIIDIGLASTPTFYFAVSHYGYDCGIQISASHNPKEYNGIKFVKNTPNGLIKIGKTTGMDKVREITLSKQFLTAQNTGSETKKENVLEDEVKNAFEIIKPGEIKRIKVVADAANAMGSLYLDTLFKKLPCELVKMNFELDGTFPSHQPDPLQFETLVDLQKKVVDEKADLGIAPDGDGDRIFFIDEKGQVIPASLTTALVITELLKKYPKEKMVYDVRYTWTAKAATEKNGGVPVVTTVGHALITETMHRENALFAGESSGHYFFRQTGFAESSMPIVLTILDVISREQKPISEILKQFAVGVESGEINFKLENLDDAKRRIEEFKEKYKDGQISTLDGLSIEYPTWRFNLRSSNTEPLLRLNLEAKTQKLMEEKRDEIVSLIKAN